MIRDSQAKRIVQRLLSPAGIVLDGHQAWDIRIHNTDFYKRILRGGSLALGESYMDGWWDCRALDQFIDRLLRSDLDRRYRALNFLNPNALRERIAASQSRSRAFEIGRRHYDLDNTFFAAMLDSGMNYSCAYWQNAADLDAAQQAHGHVEWTIVIPVCLLVDDSKTVGPSQRRAQENQRQKQNTPHAPSIAAKPPGIQA